MLIRQLLDSPKSVVEFRDQLIELRNSLSKEVYQGSEIIMADLELFIKDYNHWLNRLDRGMLSSNSIELVNLLSTVLSTFADSMNCKNQYVRILESVLDELIYQLNYGLTTSYFRYEVSDEIIQNLRVLNSQFSPFNVKLICGDSSNEKAISEEIGLVMERAGFNVIDKHDTTREPDVSFYIFDNINELKINDKGIAFAILPYTNFSLEKKLKMSGVQWVYSNPIDINHLLLSLLNMLKLVQYYKNSSYIDQLTGLPNRRYFKESIDNVSGGLSLALVDIDLFKEVNDTYGHHNGDIVLKELANLMRIFLPKEFKVYRWGGEEFIISYESKVVDLEYFNHWISSLAIEFSEKEFHFDDLVVTRTFSAGIASYPISSYSFEELFDLADKALYYAKENGRNKVVVYSDEVKNYKVLRTLIVTQTTNQLVLKNLYLLQDDVTRVEKPRNAEELSSILQRSPYDLILLDNVGRELITENTLRLLKDSGETIYLLDYKQVFNCPKLELFDNVVESPYSIQNIIAFRQRGFTE